MRPATKLALVGRAIAASLAGCGGNDKDSGPPPNAPEKIKLAGEVKDGATLDARFTCDGAGVSPSLAWSAPPVGTKELALLVEDPLAPGGSYVHWAVFGIDPKLRIAPDGFVPAGGKQGRNSSGGNNYAPPCPPKGDPPHDYSFTIYALEASLELGAGAAPQIVRQAIRDRAIAKGTITAKYER